MVAGRGQGGARSGRADRSRPGRDPGRGRLQAERGVACAFPGGVAPADGFAADDGVGVAAGRHGVVFQSLHGPVRGGSRRSAVRRWMAAVRASGRPGSHGRVVAGGAVVRRRLPGGVPGPARGWRMALAFRACRPGAATRQWMPLVRDCARCAGHA